jgi:hypothetical protein
MKLNEAFPSKFLSSDDLGGIDGDDTVVTLWNLRMDKVGLTDPKPKLIATVRLDGDEKDFVINKTNAGTIAKIHGDDTDDWEGKKITLFVTEVEYQGKVMPGIRVRLRKPKDAPKGKPADDQPPKQFAEVSDPATDDIPF